MFLNITSHFLNQSEIKTNCAYHVACVCFPGLIVSYKNVFGSRSYYFIHWSCEIRLARAITSVSLCDRRKKRRGGGGGGGGFGGGGGVGTEGLFSYLPNLLSPFLHSSLWKREGNWA